MEVTKKKKKEEEEEEEDNMNTTNEVRNSKQNILRNFKCRSPYD